MRRVLMLVLFLIAAVATPGQVYKTNTNPLGAGLFTQDAGTCSTTGSFLWQILPSNAGTTTVNLAGTFSATLTVRESNNGGGTWSTAGTISAVGTTTYSTNGFTDFCVDLTTFTSGNVQVSISTGLMQVQSVINGGSSSGGSGNASSAGMLDPTQSTYGVKADERDNNDGTTTAGGTTLSSATLNCTSADVGKTVLVIAATGAYAADTTIASCASSTVANLNATTTACPGCAWSVGTENGTVLAAAWNASIVNNQGLALPCGSILVNKPVQYTSGSLNLNAQGMTVLGCGGTRGTRIVIGKDAFTGSIAAPLFFSYPGTITGISGASGTASQFTIDQIAFTSLGGCIAIGGSASSIIGPTGARDLHFFQIGFASGSGAAILGGSSPAGGEQFFDHINMQQINIGTSCTGTNPGVFFNGQGTSTLLNSILAYGAYLTTVSTFPQNINLRHVYFANTGNPAVQVGAGTFLNIDGGIFSGTPNGSGQGAISDNNGASTIHIDDTVIAGGNTYSPVDIQNSGTVLTVRNSTCTVSGTQSCIGSYPNANPAGKFFDQGANSGFTVASGMTLIADGHSVKGTCTGTATSSSTLGLYGTGPNETTTTCTSATLGSGIAVSGSRTLQNLMVTASHAGVSASSGVVTVLRNGSPTTIACTIGTGPSCADFTHSVSVSDGDLISIQFTTQASEVLAGISAIVEWN